MKQLTPEKTVEAVAARVQHWNVDQLRELQRTITQGMVKARWTFGSYQEDEGVAIYLKNRIASLERAKQQMGLTPEEQTEAEAQQLARSHGVKIGIARKHVKRAPAPEAPTIFDERAALHEHYENVLRNKAG